jgi:hypothetical protein
MEHSIELPDKTTEIDALLSDEASSTVVLAELKWIRKPNRTLERIARDKDVEKGLSRADELAYEAARSLYVQQKVAA